MKATALDPAANLAPLDVERFWQDNEIARKNPFGKDIPQAAMGMSLGPDAIFAELGMASDLSRFQKDFAFSQQCLRAYNEKSLRIIGRTMVNENAFDPSRQFPHVKSPGEVLGGKLIWESESWWLTEAARTPQELEALLDRADKLDLESEMFPADWEEGCRRVYEKHGIRPHMGKHLRGPVTLCTSLYGAENLLYLILDQPELAARLRDTLIRVLIAYFRISDRVSADRARPGFSFADDNCALLSPEMYAFFAQPILKALFAEFAPKPEHSRYQHSDSDMGHLLELLAETGLTGVNFGPNVRFRQIRAAMPGAIVDGTVAPFTMMRNDTPRIIAEVRRDLDEAKETRGLVLVTAGSINDGTLLTSIRTVMQTIQTYGRYQ